MRDYQTGKVAALDFKIQGRKIFSEFKNIFRNIFKNISKYGKF